MFPAMAILVGIVLAFQDKPLTSQELSASKRPLISITGLNEKDIVSVSRYTNKGTPNTSFVYRYVFRGKFRDTIKAFQARLTSRDGWKLEWLKPSEALLSREIPSGPVALQGLVFHPTRLIPDNKAGHPAQGNGAKGWIWVSYNELIRKEK